MQVRNSGTVQKVKKMPKFNYRAFSYKQADVLTWWTHDKKSEGIIADGAIRSGKTLCMSLSFVLWAMETFDGHNFAMCGKTIESFRRNVLGTLKQMLTAENYQVIERRKDNLLIIRKGKKENSFYLFGGKDEGSQDLIQGITLAGIFFDEVALMPESFVNQGTARCSVTGSKYWFNCNPESPNHWFKKNWIDKARENRIKYLHFTMEDNYSLTERIKERYRTMYRGSPVFYDRYINGLWVIAEGLVYPMMSDKNIIKKPWKYDSRCHYFVSIDYGTVNPFACGIFEYHEDTGEIHLIRDFGHNGRENGRMDNEGYYELMENQIGNLPIEFILVDPSAAGFIETIRKHNKYLAKGATNDVLRGIQTVTKYINLDKLRVYDCCTNTLQEFQQYAWDEKSQDEKVIKESDHYMDALRYAVMEISGTYNAWRI